MLDLSYLEQYGRHTVVRCWDEESTLLFLDEMMRQYPDKCRHWYKGKNKWTQATNGYLDYYPYPGTNNSLCWDYDGDYAVENDYTIINFYDIPGALEPMKDLGEISCSDADLSVLF